MSILGHFLWVTYFEGCLAVDKHSSGILRWSIVGLQAVLSSGSPQLVLRGFSGGPQAVLRQSSGGPGGPQAVLWQSSSSSLAVIRRSSGSPQAVLKRFLGGPLVVLQSYSNHQAFLRRSSGVHHAVVKNILPILGDCTTLQCNACFSQDFHKTLNHNPAEN